MEESFRPPLRISEAAAKLGLTDYLVRQAIRSGELDAFHIGRSYRIRPDSVERLLRGPATPAASTDAT
jgi:excisionase family DNA binding protein